RGRAIGYPMHELAFEVAVRELARTHHGGLYALERRRELLLGELALGDAEGAPHLVAVHRALLARQPGDGADDEAIPRVDVQHVPHVAIRVADAVLRPQPAAVSQRRRERAFHFLPRLLLRRRGERRERRVDGIQTSPSKGCTCTRSPAATFARSCSSTMKQFASDIERSTPEPCCPVVRTRHSSRSRYKMPL